MPVQETGGQAAKTIEATAYNLTGGKSNHRGARLMAITYVAVDYEAIKHNLRQVRNNLATGCKLMAVVKGNAYGHGLVATARACLEAGANMLGVGDLVEGIQLRQAGIRAPVLVFLPLLEEQYAEAVAHRLTVTITNEEQLLGLRAVAERAARTVRFHIYVDSGLGRPSAGERVLDLIKLSAPWSELHLEGVYTHFDPTRPASYRISILDVLKPGAELRMFASMVKAIAREELRRDILVHAAASTSFLDDPQSHLDMVRIGTLLYGQWPAYAHNKPFELRNTFEFRTRIIALEELPPRSRIGYGGEFVCHRRTRVATLPVGYAHGVGVAPASLTGTFGRWLRQYMKGPQEVLVAGKSAPIIGRIAMEQCAIDVTDVEEAEVGSEVVIPVRRLAANPLIPRVATSLDGSQVQ